MIPDEKVKPKISDELMLVRKAFARFNVAYGPKLSAPKFWKLAQARLMVDEVIANLQDDEGADE